MQNDFSYLPEGFIYLSELCSEIIQDLKYSTEDNFTGSIVPGYEKNRVILTKAAAEKLLQVQAEVKQDGMCLKIFDAYRPVRAVHAFKDWSLALEDEKTKQRFYPDLEKKTLLGSYISDKSAHSRGSTVDLTLVNLASGKELDMGTEFDFFGEKSHTEYDKFPKDVLENRKYLKNIMEGFGFENFWREWWHYQLKNEPFHRYPQDHFDFVVR